MLKKWVVVSLLLISLSSGLGCNLFRSQSVPKKSKVMMPSARLLAFFPQVVGTVWQYDGMAEYGSKMRLQSKSGLSVPSRLIQMIRGEVADMSDGESKANFDFRLAYQFTPVSVYEKVIFAGQPFPHTVKYLRMLALPLEKGHTWQQKIRFKGKPATLKAEIVEMGKEKLINRMIETVTVRYRVPMAEMPQGVYEEVRVFAKGLGVVRFEKTFDPNPENRFNYFLRDVRIPSKKK